MKKIWLLGEGELCENICEILQLEGFDPLQVSEQEVFAASLAHAIPRVVICDINFLKANGKKFNSPKQRDYSLIVISPDGEVPENHVKADRCLAMPFTDETLVEVVKQIFNFQHLAPKLS